MTTSFRHSDHGTDPLSWQHLRGAVDDLRVPSGGEHMLVVAAHPDDETLGAGGLLASADAAGARITVVIATDGEASHPASPTRTAAELAALRRREVYAALAELAPSAQVHLLGLPDGGLVRHPDALHDALGKLLDGCSHVVTTWTGDGHPDHEACAHAVAALLRDPRHRAVRHWQYPIWAWHWGDPQQPPFPAQSLRRLPLDDAARAAKQRATAAYRSQTDALSERPGDEAVLTPRMLAHFAGDDEVYVVPAESEGGDATAPGYFDELYRHSSDPWGLDQRFYEQRKRALVLATLTRPVFERAFEPGCATGALTVELARRCKDVVAWDLADAAVGTAQRRLADAPHVHVASGHIPDEWPDGTFDLVLLSEVGYYCPDLSALVERIDSCLTDDGVLVACHWRRPAAMHAHTAGAVHAALGAGRRMIVNHVEDDFLLQVWSRTGESVATAEGIVAGPPADSPADPPAGSDDEHTP